MRCPSCQTLLEPPIATCVSCDFSLAKIDRIFGTVPKNSRHVTDLGGCFQKTQRAALRKRMKEIERTFPGLSLSIMTLNVPEKFRVREYLFWLMNRCQFGPAGDRFERSYLVVLFFDPASRSALLSTGYALENALPEEALSQIITRALPALRKDDYFSGSNHVLREVQRHIKAFCKTGRALVPRSKSPTLSAPAELKPAEDLF